MPPLPSHLLRAGVEATFVAGPTVRAGRFALWDRRALVDGFGPGAPGEGDLDAELAPLPLIAPSGARLRRRDVDARWFDVGDVIDAFAALRADAPVSASVQAWAHATRAALHLLARGRLLPTADSDGCDLWRAGPLDNDDLERWAALAAALPAAAHARELTGIAPRRVSDPAWLLARFRDAVVDTYVRTAAAAEASGHDAFASRERVTVAGSARWLVAAGGPADAAVAISLRVEVDGELPSGTPDPGSAPPPADEPATADSGPAAAPAPAVVSFGDDGGFRAIVQVSSRRDPSLVLDAAEVWAAPRAVAARFGDDVEEEVLLALRRAARVWSPVHRLLAEPQPALLELEPDEVDDLLGPIADDLAGSGIDVLWPAGILRPIEVTPTVASEVLTSDRSSGLGFDGLCELRWAATVDGEELTDDELHELADAKRSVVRLRGRWVRADPTRLARLRTRRQVTAGAALAAALGGDLVIDGETIDAEVEGPIANLAARLRDAEGRQDVEVPAALQAELRPYQRQGLTWLANMADIGFGGVLADDMGLGKTVQFIALHLHRRTTAKPTLVVCPVSVVANWHREANRFAPDVEVRRFHGTTRDLADLSPDAIVLTTYGVVRRQAETLAEIEWGLVAADEAQNMKNPVSRTARAMRRLRGEARFALTGTPVENRLLDLWALLDWTTPGLLGSQERFRHEVAIPVERDRDVDATEALSRLVRPFVLRRRKIDPGIAPDLPPKTETDEVVGLTTEQATLYTAMVDEVMEQVEAAEGIARRGLVLKLLGGLKQICNHPAQFLHQPGPLTGRSGKLDAATDIVETITAEDESVLIFTQFVTMGHLLVRHLQRPDRPVEFLHGSVPLKGREEMVDRFQAGDTRILVISLKAGGTGLNLTRATHVVHFDRWWNPAVEDQASDRAWRIGQDRPVQIHRMICEGTVEDKVAQLLTEKRQLAEAVVGTGEAWVGELSDSDLRALVALGADR